MESNAVTQQKVKHHIDTLLMGDKYNIDNLSLEDKIEKLKITCGMYILLKEIYCNIYERHNRTILPKIRVIEFVNDWRSKIKYADYNEGYTFYFNSIPQENKLNLLLR